MRGVDLFCRNEHLWSSVALALVDSNVIDGDDGFQSKLDLGPDNRVFDQTQALVLVGQNVVDVTRLGSDCSLLGSEADLVSFVVVFDERRLAASTIVADIVDYHLLE